MLLVLPDNEPSWNSSQHHVADLAAVVNLGTDDANAAKKVSSADVVEAYKKLVEGAYGRRLR